MYTHSSDSSGVQIDFSQMHLKEQVVAIRVFEEVAGLLDGLNITNPRLLSHASTEVKLQVARLLEGGKEEIDAVSKSLGKEVIGSLAFLVAMDQVYNLMDSNE